MSSIAELQQQIEKSLGKSLSELTEEEHEAFGAMIAQGMREAAMKSEAAAPAASLFGLNAG